MGYVVCTRGWVDGRPALGLGPLALVALLGHTGYDPRCGFRPAGELGIIPPVAERAAHFQVRALSAHQPDMSGAFRYAAPFDEL